MTPVTPKVPRPASKKVTTTPRMNSAVSLVWPAAGGAVVHRYHPGEGALIVMGGSMQHDWHHTVPRVRSASGARTSVTLRHSRP